MSYVKSPFIIGVSLIFIGIALIVVSMKKADKNLMTSSLGKKIFGDKTNRLISFITNIMVVSLGVILIVFDDAFEASLTIGLFLVLISIKNMTGEFSGRKNTFFEEHFGEKTNLVIELITSIFIMLVGISMLVWHFFTNKT